MAEVAMAAEDRPPPYPTTRCTSCQAPIIWAETKQLRKIPVDAEPVDATNGGGNILLSPGGVLPRATVLAPKSNPARRFGKAVYRSHFATCPYADRHRHPRARATKGGS